MWYKKPDSKDSFAIFAMTKLSVGSDWDLGHAPLHRKHAAGGRERGAACTL